MKTKKLYSVPRLVKTKKGSWYVYFRFRGKIIKTTEDMGYIADLALREKFGHALAQKLHDKLKKGWNPFVEDLTTIEGADYTFYQALEFGLQKKKPNISDVTIKNYETTLRFVKKAVPELNFNMLSIRETKRVHIKALMELMYNNNGWSKKGYNKHLNHIHAILGELLQWDVIERNPADDIRRLSVEQTEANRPPTEEELQVIVNHLASRQHSFLNFQIMQWDTGIRPVELTRLRLSMINMEKREIVLPAAITKSRKKSMTVYITDNIYGILEDIMSAGHPSEWFLFGSSRIAGRGNEGKYDDFIPGPTQLKRDTSTRRWEKLVKIELGLDVNQYGMKKAGANAKIMAGMSLRTIQQVLGHSSSKTTEIYVTKLTEFYKEEILNKTPQFMVIRNAAG